MAICGKVEDAQTHLVHSAVPLSDEFSRASMSNSQPAGHEFGMLVLKKYSHMGRRKQKNYIIYTRNK